MIAKLISSFQGREAGTSRIVASQPNNGGEKIRSVQTFATTFATTFVRSFCLGYRF